ncbi:MAG: D-ribose pyranase [Spirochaetaceae bacterium]
MKKTALLNDRISTLIAEMGHKENLMICDAGMPIPRECERIDISLMPGVPSFLQTLEAVLHELAVEKVVLAEEIKQNNKELEAEIKRIFQDIPIEYISHQEMKLGMKDSKGIIRTGEFSPFANIRLISGVVF